MEYKALTAKEQKAYELKNLINTPVYKETLGRWLAEEKALALQNIVANDPTNPEALRSQGAYRLVQLMEERIQMIVSRGEAEVKKRRKVLTK